MICQLNLFQDATLERESKSFWWGSGDDGKILIIDCLPLTPIPVWCMQRESGVLCFLCSRIGPRFPHKIAKRTQGQDDIQGGLQHLDDLVEEVHCRRQYEWNTSLFVNRYLKRTAFLRTRTQNKTFWQSVVVVAKKLFSLHSVCGVQQWYLHKKKKRLIHRFSVQPSNQSINKETTKVGSKPKNKGVNKRASGCN